MQQLELFPKDIRIERVDSDANMYRFYRLQLMPDLFGASRSCANGTASAPMDGIGSTVSKTQVARQTLWLPPIGQSRSGAISSRDELGRDGRSGSLVSQPKTDHRAVQHNSKNPIQL